MDEKESSLPGNIVFIKIPESIAQTIGNFTVNPDILIPVEIGKSSIKDLSWEMILAGMLRFLAYCPEDERASYYRGFIQSVRPELFTEFMDTGIINAKNGNLDIAEEIFKSLVGLNPESPEAKLNLAILYEDKADILDKSGKDELSDMMKNKAFELYKELLGMEPAFPDAFFNAGFFYMKNHSYDQALRMFTTYISIGSDENKKKKATEIQKKLQNRSDADSLFKESFDFIHMGQEQKGLEKALEFTKLDPSVWNGWFLVGWANRRLGNWNEGREAFMKALANGGEEVDVYNELAICEMELQMYKDSRRHLETALRKQPENIKIISNLAVVASKTGNIDEAKGFYRTVLEIDPDDKLAKKQLDELEE